MTTLRFTMAQALVRFLAAQRSGLNGHKVPLLRAFCSGSLALASLDPARQNLAPVFSPTPALAQSSLRWLEIGS